MLPLQTVIAELQLALALAAQLESVKGKDKDLSKQLSDLLVKAQNDLSSAAAAILASGDIIVD